MTYPRAHLVDPNRDGTYHVFTRCVQQQWLCGKDPATGRNFEHRKQWVEDRLLELASVFAVDLLAFSVLSNHYHAIVALAVSRSREWTDLEVATRWLQLRPSLEPDERSREYERLVADPDRLAVLRARLGSLSWFMRYLNEHIARRANLESGTSGRFWQGRFQSKALLDDNAVLAGMAYVDLNPLRAGIVTTPHTAPYTSIRRRVRCADHRSARLVPLTSLGLTLAGYRALLEWTASAHGGTVKSLSTSARKTLSHAGHRPDAWLGRVMANRRKYRAYGALPLLRAYASTLGQRWLQGARPGLAAPS